MFGYKGGGIVFLRETIKRHDKERELLGLLNTEEQELYKKTLEVSWVPMPFTAKLFTLTARLCCGDLPKNEGLKKIGTELAKSSINQIYRMVFKLMSPKVLMEKAANLWRTYHQGGTGSVTDFSSGRMTFTVLDYPDLPEDFAEATSGYIIGLIELTGAKNCRVQKSKEKDQWVWRIQWDV